MQKRIMTTGMCKHCGITLWTPGQHWCRVCVDYARNNHGVCGYCHHDVSEFFDCWTIKRRLDHAVVDANIPTRTCPSCFEHLKRVVEFEVERLVIEGNKRCLTLVCPVCQTQAHTDVTLFRPPPDGLPVKP